MVDSGGQTTVVIIDPGGTLAGAGATFRVTVNSFLAAGGDRFTTFTAGTGRKQGVRDVDALARHLESYKPPAQPYDPASPELLAPRVIRK